MPFYRYECRNCGHEFRYLHFDSNSDEVACPKCKGTDLERQMPRVAIQFKGSGYYKTDRADKKSKAGTRGSSERESSSDSGDSRDSRDSSDSKPSTESKSGEDSKSSTESKSDKHSKND
ncbi:zinc ribbon domain-containing protein [Candidatus Bipolaricaulota bacterium]|nr:zinc ribbon domain-containing protein [Candidatus Bipolaricaulota bacterium]